MATAAIQAEGLFKQFGKVEAVAGTSFTVHQGEMFGLVGPDGAGKTTTIRSLCGLLNPDRGTLRLLGLEMPRERKKIQEQIGYLSQKFSLYGDLSVEENIRFFANIHDVRDHRERMEELLAFTRLTPFKERLADRLSGGMKQKLALACSLIHRPRILFLDEPTTGVDPVSRRDFWKILSDLLRDGMTILIATPYLDEAERCERIALMHKGKIIISGSPEAVKQQTGIMAIEITCSPAREARDVLLRAGFRQVQLFGDKLHLLSDAPATLGEKAEQVLRSGGILVSGRRIIPPTLENVFIHAVAGESLSQ